MSARDVRAVLALAAFAAALLVARTAHAGPVKVEGGLVEGTVEDGLTVYRGIPFAAPPVGDLRWRAPHPAAKWNGVRKADAFGHFLHRQPSSGDLALSDTMITYWTNFAKGYDPNGAGLPAWPPYNEAAPRMMYLIHSPSSSPKAGPLVSERGLKVLDDYFAWRRQP